MSKHKKAGISNTLLGCINWMILCMSLPFLIIGVLVKVKVSSPCDPILLKPLVAIGVGLAGVSVLGLIAGCCWRIKLLMWLYAIALVILIIGLLASLVIGGMIVKGGANGKVQDVFGGLKECKLEGFSNWLQKRNVGSESWEDTKECMIKHNICGKVHSFRTIVDFISRKSSKLSSIETGCCKPPADCGFQLKSDTEWTLPEEGFQSEDKDCKLWDNDKEKLCYSCDTCKAGYLAMLVMGWRKLLIVNAILIVVVFFVFIIALCALM